MNAMPPEPVISEAISRPASVPQWRKIDWPRTLPEPIPELRGGRYVIPQSWLLRELRRTLAHEAAQMIIDDDKAAR